MLDLYGKEALAWLKVNRNFTPEDGRANTRCYVFPKYLIEDNRYIEIDPTDFPQRGAIEVSILGGKTAFDIEREFGDNVIVRFNNDPELNQNPSADNKYFSLYNPKLPGTDIDFINISALHLRQIIDCNSTYDYLEKVRTV